METQGMDKRMRWITPSNGVVDAAGFVAGHAACDIRGNGDGARKDVALVWSALPCNVAATFTRNTFAAAPVQLARQQLAGSAVLHGFVANSGNANACTGEQGMVDAQQMAAHAARACGLPAGAMLVCSTGRIGRCLPMQRVCHGIDAAASVADGQASSGLAAADAILTSDTRRKVATVELMIGGRTVRIGAMAKGAGMIEPNMATMLAFLCTDLEVAREHLQAALRKAVGDTFNAVTVDGDQSTNDTVLLLANGHSGVAIGPENGEDWLLFEQGLHAVCHALAQKIVGDGEKITKVVEVSVAAAATAEQAKAAARAVGNSLLVKTSWYGSDPNWGRLLDAVGYSGAETSEQQIEVYYADADGGSPVAAFVRGKVMDGNVAEWKRIVAAPRFRIQIVLGSGAATARIWATDLTEGYVHFNKSE